MRKLIAIVVAVSASSPAFARHIHCAPAPEVGADIIGLAVIAACGIGWFALRNTRMFRTHQLA